MIDKRVVMVIDMQNGVFDLPRQGRELCVANINRLTALADKTIFIQHREPGRLDEGSEAFALLPEVNVPENAHLVTKTACDAFWNTSLAALLRARGIRSFIVCGCATDYCVDSTIKQAVGLGFSVTVASDAHTTADRQAAKADVLIAHYNEVWRTLNVPGNPVRVCTTAELIAGS